MRSCSRRAGLSELTARKYPADVVRKIITTYVMARLARYLSMAGYIFAGAAGYWTEEHSGVRWCAVLPDKTTITAGSFRLPRTSTVRAAPPGPAPAGSWFPAAPWAGPGGLCRGSHSRGNYHKPKP